MDRLLFLFCLLINLSLYPATFVVTEIDYAEDVVVVEDYNGNIWSFDGTEDWMVGDIVSAVMYGKGTPEIWDDEFVTCRYSGNINN